mmetsp:Transcript_71309/g.183823  ORF Transcript_71309/g.183823 Transcript_71309/m.183823 type:complete len:295 (+) Transcript_71309:886-1770(+)
MPSFLICSAAAAANMITSPCVTSATVGMFLPTRGSFSSVFDTFDTRTSWPQPLMRMSNLPSNLPNSRQGTSCLNSSGVRASGPKGMPCCSQCVTASKVSERKTLPFDQFTALGSTACSLATVVPLPVPLRPCSTSTQPSECAAPSFVMMEPATWSADLPRTSMVQVGSTGGSFGITPFSTALAMPAASFSSSSASRCWMPFVSASESELNRGSSSKASMMALDVLSSPRWSSSLLRPNMGASVACSTACTSSGDGEGCACSASRACPIMRCAARRMPMMMGSFSVNSKRCGVRT